MWLLVVLLLIVPLVELYVIVAVAGSIGILPTLALLVAISVTGSWLVRREGLGVYRRCRQMWAARQNPTDDLLDGLLVLAAGLMLLTPGFVTDALGLVLLVPPVRRLVRSSAFAPLRRRLSVPIGGATYAAGMASDYAGRRRQRVYVGEAVLIDERPPPTLPGPQGSAPRPLAGA